MYRDVSEPTSTSSPRRPAADDAAYWYDLLAEDAAPQDEQARGPFEPLLPSGAPTGAAGRPPAAEPERGSPGGAGNDRQEAPEQARARKLEQLKDLYLTAEAIGEQNVDKHFDQLLAQQRELISDYFGQSAAAQPGGPGPGEGGPRDGQAAETGAAHPDPGAAGGPPGPPEGAGVRAEPPRAW
ncbi:MAG TPA: hypothetical protein VGS06_38940 [Streptosporangiaceae bacterium]|nr:hypothetical protein [Streptosporangiaceae bacterium]